MSEARAAPVLSLSEVSSGYGAVLVVKSVTLSVRPGEIVAVLGKNGMGKSTLLKTILGLVSLRGGGIHVGGMDQANLTPARMIAWGLSYVPQEQALFQDLSIRDNLRLAVRSDRELDAALDHAFGYFPFLRERLRQPAGTLSGGEQKMLILARALVLRPRLLLVDEISEGLQPTILDRIVGILRDERSRAGTAMLVVEQNLDFALRVADRWAVLKMGEIDDEGPGGLEARARPRTLEPLVAQPFVHCVSTASDADQIAMTAYVEVVPNRNKRRSTRHGLITPTVAGVSFMSKPMKISFAHHQFPHGSRRPTAHAVQDLDPVVGGRGQDSSAQNCGGCASPHASRGFASSARESPG